jgi:hypothetical protein
MTASPEPGRDATAGHVRLVTVQQAIAEARTELDEYERRYGVTSDRLQEAFTDGSGRLRQTGEYLRWAGMLERWRELTARAAS